MNGTPGRRMAHCGALFAGLVLWGACASAPAHHAELAIRNTTVVDFADGTLAPDQTVLVTGNRIVAVGPAHELAVPDRAGSARTSRAERASPAGFTQARRRR